MFGGIGFFLSGNLCAGVQRLGTSKGQYRSSAAVRQLQPRVEHLGQRVQAVSVDGKSGVGHGEAHPVRFSGTATWSPVLGFLP